MKRRIFIRKRHEEMNGAFYTVDHGEEGMKEVCLHASDGARAFESRHNSAKITSKEVGGGDHKQDLKQHASIGFVCHENLSLQYLTISQPLSLLSPMPRCPRVLECTHSHVRTITSYGDLHLRLRRLRVLITGPGWRRT